MARGSLEQRRWENGLRREVRAAAPAASVEPSPARRTSGLKRPTVQPGRRINTTDKLPTTASMALEAYLSKDCDALPRYSPVSRGEAPRGFIVVAGNEKRLSEGEAKRRGSGASGHLRMATKATAASCRDGGAGPRPESPLSRFQKQVRHTRWRAEKEDTRSPNVGATETAAKRLSSSLQDTRSFPSRASQSSAKSSQLTRSLMEKIQEAKTLRSTPSLKGNPARLQRSPDTQDRLLCSQQSVTGHHGLLPPANRTPRSSMATTALEQTITIATTPASPPNMDLTALESPFAASVPRTPPPVPHTKPEIPTMPLMSTTLSTTEESMTADQCKKPLEELKKGPIPDTALPSVDAAILAAKAALIIQRVWKKRLRCRERRSDRVEPPEFVEVSIVIDKIEEVRVVAPLFWAAPKAPCNPAAAQLQRETGPLLVEDESEAVPSLQWAEEEALTTDTKYPNAVEAQELPRSSWIDEEFIFLEEGRRGPELVDVVRRGVFMEEDELVWKHPQHVVNLRERQRLATVQSSRQSRRSTRRVGTQLPLAVESLLDRKSSAVVDAHCSHPSSGASWVREHAVVALETGRTSRRRRHLLRVCLRKQGLANGKKLLRPDKERSSRKRRVLVGTVQLEQQQDEEQRGQEMGSTVDEPRSGGAGGEGAATNIEISVDVDQFGAHHGSEPSGSAVPASGKGDRDEQPKSLAQGAVTTQDGFDRFVVFSGSWFPSNAHVADSNTPNPRNDLIYVGDLAVAGDLLRTGHLHPQREQARGIREDFILLPGGNPMVAMLGADPFVQENDARRDELDPRSLAESWLSGREASSDRTGDEDAIGDGDSTEETKTQPIVSTSLQLESPCSEMESLPESFADGEAIRSLSESGGEVREGLRVDEGGETLLLHGSGTKADPFSALEVLESGASETLTRIHVQYSEEVALEDRSSASCGQSEAQSLMQLAPANATAVISTSRPRLDMDKRLEFLRVLDEFKRCLRPSSASPSSSSSTEDTPLFTPPSLSRSSASSKVQHADLGSEAEDEEAMDDTLQKARQNDQAAHIL